MQSLIALDEDARYLVGQERFDQLQELYMQLLTYVNHSREMTLFERLRNGLQLLFNMSTVLGRLPVWGMKDEQWEERIPIEDLIRLGIESFWTVKKPMNRRPRRSTHRFSSEILLTKECDLKSLWSEFVLFAVRISMDARSNEESFDWSCSFDRLYNEYIFSQSTPVKNSNQSTCLNFDEYLYRKISSLEEWNECISDRKLSPKPEWCLAWKRFVRNHESETDYSIKFYENSSSTLRKPFLKWSYYLQIVRPIIH